MSDELKPCPFCGSKATISGPDIDGFNREWWFVWCEDCGVQGDDYQQREYAIQAWNTRKGQDDENQG